MKEAKNVWRTQTIPNVYKPSLPYVSMFVCLPESIHSLLGTNDKWGCYENGPPLKPRNFLSHGIC